MDVSEARKRQEYDTVFIPATIHVIRPDYVRKSGGLRGLENPVQNA
jgi:hypothetical protein